MFDCSHCPERLPLFRSHRPEWAIFRFPARERCDRSLFFAQVTQPVLRNDDASSYFHVSEVGCSSIQTLVDRAKSHVISFIVACIDSVLECLKWIFLINPSPPREQRSLLFQEGMCSGLLRSTFSFCFPRYRRFPIKSADNISRAQSHFPEPIQCFPRRARGFHGEFRRRGHSALSHDPEDWWASAEWMVRVQSGLTRFCDWIGTFQLITNRSLKLNKNQLILSKYDANTSAEDACGHLRQSNRYGW